MLGMSLRLERDGGVVVDGGAEIKFFDELRQEAIDIVVDSLKQLVNHHKEGFFYYQRARLLGLWVYLEENEMEKEGLRAVFEHQLLKLSEEEQKVLRKEVEE
jgi:hypothetical protein